MNTGKQLIKIKKISQNLAAYLDKLDQLHIIIFSSYIQRDYFARQMEYEKKLILQSRLLMLAIQKVRHSMLGVPEKLDWHDKIISRFENLYEILYSLDLLKYRLLDHATFEVCENEFKNISKTITEMLLGVSHLLTNNKKISAPSSLDTQIQALEILFQNTLQFITADPMFFLFFIRDLKALNDELKNLYNDIELIK